MRPKTLKAYLVQQFNAAKLGHVTRPIIISGAPGVGKSDIVAQAAAEWGGKPLKPKAGLEKLDLIVREPADIGGLPYPIEQNGKTVLDWLPPAWSERLMAYYKETKEPSCAFIDDIGAAQPAVQIAALRLLLEDESGAAELPPKCVKIAATNRASDNTVHWKMPSPLANRFKWINLDVNYEDWCEYATHANYYHSVIAFHRATSGKYLTAKKPLNDGAYETPRSWHFLSDEMKVQEALAGGIAYTDNDEIREWAHEILGGIVGQGAGTAFYAWLKVYRDLLSVDEILAGKTDAFPDKPDQQWAIVSSIAARFVTEPNKHAKRIVQYALKIKQKEFAVVLIRDCVNGVALKPQQNPLVKLREFDDVIANLGKIV